MGDARWDYSDLIYAWFDHWLKGEDNGITETLPEGPLLHHGLQRVEHVDGLAACRSRGGDLLPGVRG